MKKIITLILFLIITLQSCSPKIRTNLSSSTYKSLEPDTEILIVKQDEKIPENSKFIGDLKIGDSGFSTDCGYTKVMNEAKIAAKKSGANLIHLIRIKKPNFGSTCYRIKAKLYRNLNSELIVEISENRRLENKSRLPSDADYAIVHFYRPKNFTGSLIGYKIRMNDETVIGRVRNGEKFQHKITNFKEHKFWAKTESKTSIIIDIKKGQEYFVRCGINIGIAIGKPEMYLVDNDLGISEYESLKVKK